MTPRAQRDGSGILWCEGEEVLRWRILKGAADLQPTTWHPEFGVSLPCQRLRVWLVGGESHVEFSWKNP